MQKGGRLERALINSSDVDWGFELVDREFATKVARKDGRESKLAVAWKVEVLAIDASNTGEKPFSNGIWDVQPKSLSPK